MTTIIDRLLAHFSLARFFSLLAILVLGIARPSMLHAETAEEKFTRQFNSIVWQDGPCTANLGNVADLVVPHGYRFTGPQGARTWWELNGNPPSSETVGLLIPSDMSWFVIFNFDAAGYVRDDEKNSIDADALLAAIRKGAEQGNVYRRQHGHRELFITGWDQKPAYDSYSHNLVWAIRGHSSDGDVVNYDTRILGRSGYMSANLVISPAAFGATTPTVKGLLTGFRFKTGQKYAEWRSGDRVAKYGLGALILGGSTAVAAKTGLLAKLGAFLVKVWKPIVLAVGAFFAWAQRGTFFSQSKTS